MKLPETVEKGIEKTGGVERIKKILAEREEMIKQVAKIHHALSDPIRMEILHALSMTPLCVCMLKEITGAQDSKLSYHLSVLKEAGLVADNRESNWRIYAITALGKKYITAGVV